jgi:hypothetical protein
LITHHKRNNHVFCFFFNIYKSLLGYKSWFRPVTFCFYVIAIGLILKQNYHLYVEICDRINIAFWCNLKLWMFFVVYQTNLIKANWTMHFRISIWNFATYKVTILSIVPSSFLHNLCLQFFSNFSNSLWTRLLIDSIQSFF